MDNFGKLRNIRTDELELMLSWRNLAQVRANMYTQHEISLAEHRQWWAAVEQRDDCRYFMYEFEVVPQGIVAFTDIALVNRKASWAFYAAAQAPAGTGSKMEFLALDYAFDTLQLHKLNCEVLAFNKPVLKLHARFGFKTEGIFRQDHYQDGQFIDIHRLGILATEWQQKRQSIRDRLNAYGQR